MVPLPERDRVPSFPKLPMLPTDEANVVPRLLITMGDVAGIGPEIIARAWPELTTLCRPTVVGDPAWMRWAIRLVGSSATVQPVLRPDEAEPARNLIPCVRVRTSDLNGVKPGQVSTAAGQA